MNLLPLAIRKNILVDYENTDALGVYKNLFLVCLEREQRLSQVACGWGSDAVSSQTIASIWPTWVPNWKYSSRSKHLLNLASFASSCSAAQAEHRSPGYLDVTGIELATISEVSSVLNEGSSLIDLVKHFNEWDLDRLQETQHPTSEATRDAYLRTRMTNRFRDRFALTPHYYYQLFRDALVKMATGEQSTNWTSATEVGVKMSLRVVFLSAVERSRATAELSRLFSLLRDTK